MRINFLFCFCSIIIIIVAVIKIVFHLNFWFLPMVFFTIGLISAFWNLRYSLLLFFFLLPFVNSTPELFDNGYPSNYMAPSLFLISGVIFAMVLKNLKYSYNYSEQKKRLDWSFNNYYIFLLFLTISTIFVLFRWSNISFKSIAALGADTPVAPTGERISFASIFPVVSLFIYFISPYIFFLIKKINIKEKSVFIWLSSGFFISVALAIIQKFFNQSLISERLGKELKQFNGGFSDFNAFGAFSGMMFLWSTYEIKKKNILDMKAAEIMTPSPKTVDQDLTSAEALGLMELYEIMHLVIVDRHHRVKGVLHLHDVLGRGEYSVNGAFGNPKRVHS